MSGIRISEFAGLPSGNDGGWYRPEGREGSVRIERGDNLGAPDADAGRWLATWHGVRIHRCGSGERGSLAYLLKYPVPLDYLDEFDAWFQYEHMPMLLEEPSWHGCELFRALGPSNYPFVALHQVERRALTSDARNRSVDTPWWHRLKQHAWFDKQFVRLLMTPL